MCQAFSCIVEPSAKVTWKFGVDSHTELVKLAGLRDQTADPAQVQFARVEITPDNKDYLHPDHWTLRVDESIKPTWFNHRHEEACFAGHKKWCKALDKILVKKEIVHPFKVKPPAKITKQHIKLLKKWREVRDSVGDSVRDSVRDSVYAYLGSLFKLPSWRYVKSPKGQYPFQPCVDLWEQGLVPSFDGTTWRLHAGPKAEIVYQIADTELADIK